MIDYDNNLKAKESTAADGMRMGYAAVRHGMVGNHPLMLAIYRQIEQIGAANCAVLILGETGTGKELVAKALHDTSPHRGGPFEVINCGAIPRDLAESELFGHERGSFTGALRTHTGMFERAHNGTLFLDEIGELPIDLQPKLLRVLEDGCCRRVGSEQRRKVNVRIIAATHRNLLAEIERGRFRLDLYHRLSVGVIDLPALAQRAEDVPLLISAFIQQHTVPPRRVTVSDAAMARLQSHHWIGNVRALRNAVQRALLSAKDTLGVNDFDFLWKTPDLSEARAGYVPTTGKSFREIQRDIFIQALEQHRWNRSAAALSLRIPKSTFFDQLRALKIGT